MDNEDPPQVHKFWKSREIYANSRSDKENKQLMSSFIRNVLIFSAVAGVASILHAAFGTSHGSKGGVEGSEPSPSP